jgi:hypothetical protein
VAAHLCADVLPRTISPRTNPRTEISTPELNLFLLIVSSDEIDLLSIPLSFSMLPTGYSEHGDSMITNDGSARML